MSATARAGLLHFRAARELPAACVGLCGSLLEEVFPECIAAVPDCTACTLQGDARPSWLDEGALPRVLAFPV